MLVGKNNLTADDIFSDFDLNDQLLVKVNDYLSLTSWQIKILSSFNIDYQVSSLKELLFKVDLVLSVAPDEDLSLIADELSERIYYENNPN